MIDELSLRREDLAALCRRFHVRRLEVFGSAARGADFDPARSDADFLVTFEPAARNDLAAFSDFKDELEKLLGRPVTSWNAKPSRRAATSSVGERSWARPERSMAEFAGARRSASPRYAAGGA